MSDRRYNNNNNNNNKNEYNYVLYEESPSTAGDVASRADTNITGISFVTIRENIVTGNMRCRNGDGCLNRPHGYCNLVHPDEECKDGLNCDGLENGKCSKYHIIDIKKSTLTEKNLEKHNKNIESNNRGGNNPIPNRNNHPGRNPIPNRNNHPGRNPIPSRNNHQSRGSNSIPRRDSYNSDRSDRMSPSKRTSHNNQSGGNSSNKFGGNGPVPRRNGPVSDNNNHQSGGNKSGGNDPIPRRNNHMSPSKRTSQDNQLKPIENKRPSCTFFNSERGCNRGADCPFSHDKLSGQSNKKPMGKCYFYANGGCEKGSKCKYEH